MNFTQSLSLPKVLRYKSLERRRLALDARVSRSAFALQKVGSVEQTIFLDEKGKGLSSEEFASFLEQQMNSGISSMTFVIGGAYGFQQDLLPGSAKKIRLSEMTLNHQMVRILFLEQLYRAFTIIRGESYHH